MTTNIEKDLVEKLKGSKTSEIYSTLVKIRKSYVRNLDKMQRLQKYSVIKFIIPLIEHPKFCNISLSIIADACLEQSFIKEVIKCDGPKALIRIMKSGGNDDIRNRACRALGNIAKYLAGFKVVHFMKPIPSIINFLVETTDVNCQQTAVRTLMILGKGSKAREIIVQENGLIYIAKLLHSSHIQVLTYSVKAISVLTHNCSISCARQLLEFKFHKVLVELHSHSEKTIRNHVLISLKNLSFHEEIRSELVKAGAVKIFIEVLSASESHEMTRHAALALCKFLDHIHMWSHNGTDRSVGLKALLEVLKNKQFKDIHIPVLASLIPLSYEFNVTDILLNLDILQILIEILDSFVKKYECKTMRLFYTKHVRFHNPFSSEYKVYKEHQLNDNKLPCERLTECYLHLNGKNSEKDFEKVSEIYYPSDKSHLGSHDECPYKCVTDCYFNLYKSEVTSDYSGSCSPSGTCSPVKKNSASPEFNYDIDVGSPSTGQTSSGIWSPNSLADESIPNDVNYCWSPAVSTHSSSPVPEFEYEDNEDIMKLELPLIENFNLTYLNMNDQEKISNNSSSVKSDNVKETKILSKFSKTNFYEDSELATSNKKFKATISNTYNQLEMSYQNSVEINSNKFNDNMCLNSKSAPNYSHDMSVKNSPGEISLDCSETNKSKTNIYNCETSDSISGTYSESALDDNEQPADLKLLNVKVDQQTIDHYIILFILQISFHMEKRFDSFMAERSFFSVLVDYLCLIHNPSLKAVNVLLNLIKNRYCLEKLITNGFFCELETKITILNYPCYSHKSALNECCCQLIDAGKKELESDYGVGTLAHILITSDKKGQFHAICTSKLVTDKTSIYKLLIEANGLSLLLEFLSDSDDVIKKDTVMSLLVLHQSLRYVQKKFQKKSDNVPSSCCLHKTCSMKTSTQCFYKECFLNATFVVNGGAKILANREKICENSDYFRALLQGHFQESNSDVIILPDISAENLSTIFHFLHGCVNETCCPYLTRIPFSVLLELLSDCERFLLTSIKKFVEDRLCHGSMKPTNNALAYKQAKLYNSPEVANRILIDTFSHSTTQKLIVWQTCKELLDVGSNVNILSDIEEMFKSLLLKPL